jgi:predicted DNA-binding protein with PD1-like motif
MKSRLLNDDGPRTYAVALESGEPLIGSLTQFARSERLSGGEFTAIGALATAKLAFFNWETKAYDELPVDEQTELLSLNGRVTLPEGADVAAPDFDRDPHFHVHCVLGRRDGSTIGGHLMEAEVRPTCEVFLTESPVHLTRRTDPESGLPVLDPEAG